MLKVVPDISTRERLKKAKLYCITLPPRNGQSYEETVESACRGDADVIQLREKNLSVKELVSLGKKLKEICSHYQVLFIVNDRIDVALACGADGVHLGQDDLPLAEAKKIVDEFFSTPHLNPLPQGERKYERETDFIIGCSTHSLEQALKAEEDGADYIACGPIFATPTKPDVLPVGLKLVRQYKEQISIPFVAIGGINETNVSEVIRAGAKCVAVVRAVLGAEDIEGSARSLKNKIEFAFGKAAISQ